MNPEPHLYVHRYRLVTLDVWGNPVDGWEVNNWHRHGAPVLKVLSPSADGPTESEVLRVLRAEGHIKSGLRASSIELEWHDMGWSVRDVRQPRLPAVFNTNCPDYGWGRPVYELETETE